MPTAKQLQNAKTKLKKTTKPTGNKPTIPTAAISTTTVSSNN